MIIQQFANVDLQNTTCPQVALQAKRRIAITAVQRFSLYYALSYDGINATAPFTALFLYTHACIILLLCFVADITMYTKVPVTDTSLLRKSRVGNGYTLEIEQIPEV